MDNLKNEDTQKNVSEVSDFVTTMKSKGLNFGDRSKTPKKTNQQKLIYQNNLLINFFHLHLYQE